MQKYLTIRDFNQSVGVMPVLQSIVAAVSPFFFVVLFFVFLLGSASSYFAILKTTGRRKFWQSTLAMSFATFIFSIILTGMNSAETTFLSGYWVGFYILMTLISWLMLSLKK